LNLPGPPGGNADEGYGVGKELWNTEWQYLNGGQEQKGAKAEK